MKYQITACSSCPLGNIENILNHGDLTETEYACTHPTKPAKNIILRMGWDDNSPRHDIPEDCPLRSETLQLELKT